MTSAALFRTMQASHFHEPSSTPPKSPPHPTADEVTTSPAPSSPSSSSSLSMSDSSPPKSQSKYQATKAPRDIVPSSPPIFLMVRRCSSSQYVVPIDSIRSLKADTARVSTPSPAAAVKAWSAFCRSSSRSSLSSVSSDPASESAPPFPEPPRTSSEYQAANEDRAMKPVPSGSMMASCLSNSSP